MNINLIYRIDPNLPDWMQPGYMACDDDDNFTLEDDTSIEGLLCPPLGASVFSDDYDYSMSSPENLQIEQIVNSRNEDNQVNTPMPITPIERLSSPLERVSSGPPKLVAVEKETIIQAPSAVVSALLSVGVHIPPYTASAVEVPQLVDCDFSELSHHYMIVGDSTVDSWDVPRSTIPYLNREVSEEFVRSRNYQVLDIQQPLAGIEWRSTSPGAVAAQLVAHTASGEHFAYLWYEKICRKVVALTSALYYCRGAGTPLESFALWRGESAYDVPSAKLDWHPAYYRTLLNYRDHDDMIVRFDSAEYMLKTQKTINLHINSGRGWDLDGVSYDIKGAPEVDTITVAELRWHSASVIEFLCWRPDVLRADTTAHITAVAESLTVLEFIDLVTSLSLTLPSVNRASGSYLRLSYPYVNSRGFTPFSLSPGHPLHLHLCHLIRNTRLHFGVLVKRNLNCNIYVSEMDSLRGKFYTLYRATSGKLWCIYTRRKWYYTLVPTRTTVRIVIRHISNCSRLWINRLKGCVQDIYGERFVVFYASLNPLFDGTI